MKNSGCGCNCPESSCETTIAELPRYYPRQLITPDDLTLEQNYFRDRMRRHNRLLHGWGVVCGALVCPVPAPVDFDSQAPFVPWQVQVQTGYILGPYGDEIIIDCRRIVDLRTSGVSGVTGEPCLDPVDPWCTTVFDPPEARTLYIAVKYKQCMTRPVRVQPAGCGCNDLTCEYSRWHDGYEIGVLTECPPCNQPELDQMTNRNDVPRDLESLAKGGIPECPDCSCGPWVGLAAVAVDQDGNIKQIDNCSCRRLVISFANYHWNCAAVPPTVTGVSPDRVTADGNDVEITVTGQNFRCGAMVSAAPLDVTDVQFDNAQNIRVTLSADVGTEAKQYDLTLTNMDGTKVTKAKAITVTVPTTPPDPVKPKKPIRKKPPLPNP